MGEVAYVVVGGEPFRLVISRKEYLLLTTHHLPLLTTHYRLLTTDHRQLTTHPNPNPNPNPNLLQEDANYSLHVFDMTHPSDNICAARCDWSSLGDGDCDSQCNNEACSRTLTLTLTLTPTPTLTLALTLTLTLT